MKIEAGKAYVDGNGDPWVNARPKASAMHQLFTLMRNTDGAVCTFKIDGTFRPDGRSRTTTDRGFDLVREWADETLIYSEGDVMPIGSAAPLDEVARFRQQIQDCDALAHVMVPDGMSMKEAVRIAEEVNAERQNANDPVNRPAHYTGHPSGVECIQITEHMSFCRGNAMKYIWRAGDKGNEVQDLEKAIWYLQREIGLISRKAS